MLYAAHGQLHGPPDMVSEASHPSGTARVCALCGRGRCGGRCRAHPGFACPGAARNIDHDVQEANTRVYATPLAQPYHTDSADAVGLLCLRRALQGGLSSWASSISVHNELLRRGRRARTPPFVGLGSRPTASRRWQQCRRARGRPCQRPALQGSLPSWASAISVHSKLHGTPELLFLLVHPFFLDPQLSAWRIRLRDYVLKLPSKF